MSWPQSRLTLMLTGLHGLLLMLERLFGVDRVDTAAPLRLAMCLSWPVLPCAVVIACAGLHVGERAMHGRLPRWQDRVAQSLWGPAFEGAALGVVLMAAVVVSGARAEFIYFQF